MNEDFLLTTVQSMPYEEAFKLWRKLGEYLKDQQAAAVRAVEVIDDE